MTFFPPADDFSQLLYFIVQQINKTMQKVGSTSVGGEGCCGGGGRVAVGGGGLRGVCYESYLPTARTFQ